MVEINLKFKDMDQLQMFIKTIQFARDDFKEYAFFHGGDGYDNVNACDCAIPQLFKKWEELGGEIER